MFGSLPAVRDGCCPIIGASQTGDMRVIFCDLCVHVHRRVLGALSLVEYFKVVYAIVGTISYI